MTKTASNNKVSSQGKDFWTSQASQCPHQRLRQALMFNPYSTARQGDPEPSPQAQILNAVPKRRVVQSRKPAIKTGAPNITQMEANIRRWKRDFAAFGRTMASFLIGLLSFLTCQMEV